MSAIGTKRTWVSAPHMSAFDPKRTWAVHCVNGFDAGFSPYQRAYLSQYNVAS